MNTDLSLSCTSIVKPEPMKVKISTPFLWYSSIDSAHYYVTEMRTTHLFYTIRMIFNFMAPWADKIPGCKNWVIHRKPGYLKEAAIQMMSELADRPMLPNELIWQLKHIIRHGESVFGPRIPKSIRSKYGVQPSTPPAQPGQALRLGDRDTTGQASGAIYP